MNDFINGLTNGFIDSSLSANIDYVPRLLINNPDAGEKVLTDIKKELRRCDEFMFCVAFLNNSGFQALLNSFIEAEDRGIKGKIIVSQYQNFTEPKALRRLKERKNIELKIVTEDEAKLHSKGYIFRKDNEYTVIIGSSNLTQSALAVNKEWNVRFNSLADGTYTKKMLEEFNYLWDIATNVTDDYINSYENIYKDIQKTIDKTKVIDLVHTSYKPNKMQKEALETLKLFRDGGENRALAVSSTGSGKTVLLGLDVYAYNPSRFLFIVHRENIARAAMKTFKRIFGDTRTYALIGGGNIGNADFIFSTIQSLSKDNYLELFERDTFDYIAIDETHRAGAASYQKVINYFKPKFLLGLTATPERGDGYNIYQLYNYNLACDIRLQEALKEDLVCPFHYYALSDFTVDGNTIDDNSSFAELVSTDRVNHIVNKIETYGYDGNKVKGLIFVSRVDEAKVLSEEFNKRGYNTISLSGSDSEDYREAMIERLESDDADGLDYIFTVDLFNEGVDIPKINQIVMIRPTSSAIIFVQQLGRGLRKSFDKSFVVVLDFVGNYNQSFLIPIALSGDKSLNKDTLRRHVKEINKTIHGASTVEFERVVEERIFKSIEKADFTQVKVLRDSYRELKNKLGKIPSLLDFDIFGSIDPILIFNRFDSYYDFLTRNDKDYLVKLNAIQATYLKLISQKYASGKKLQELLTIKELLNGILLTKGKLEELCKVNNLTFTDNTWISIVNQMTGTYIKGSEAPQYKHSLIAKGCNDGIEISDELKSLIQSNIFKELLNETIEFSIARFKSRYSNAYKDSNFVLYEKYTYDDVCRLLDWHYSEVATNIGGYKYNEATNTYPVFINYQKSEDINESIKYEDFFESRNIFHAISKNKRTNKSNDILRFKHAKENNTKILLFVRRNKSDKCSKEFYFLGYITPIENNNFIEEYSKTNDKIVKIIHKLDEPVREDIYDYITNTNI